MRAIQPPHAAVALPFSPAIEHEGTVYVSGQGPLDMETGSVIDGTPREQTRRTLDNIAEILEAAGSSLEQVLRATVYLRDMDTYDAVNEGFEEKFAEPYPARTAIGVTELPVDIAVEIDVIAFVD